MAYAAMANKDKASFHVAKSWHNRFAGPRGSNLIAASKQFKCKIKMAPRETPQTGIFVTGVDANIVEEVRKHFEKIMGFSIGSAPLKVQKCKLVPLEINKLTENRDLYISMVQKHGVAVAFPRKGAQNALTMIQGRSQDIKAVIGDFGKILQREIEIEKDADDQKSNDDGGKKLDVSHRRFHKTMSRLNMQLNEVLFFHPRENDDHDFERFLEVLSSADHSIDICVFTITDNRIRYCLANEARSGVKVRIITDNSQVFALYDWLQKMVKYVDKKAESLGSDAKWLNDNAGIAVKVDYDPNEVSHMHHKYAIIDNRIVMTGSFNWTRSASDKNYENVTITSNKQLVKQFHDYFVGMWSNDKSIVDISVYQYQTKH